MGSAGQRATDSACTIRLLRTCGIEGVPRVMGAWACKVILSAIGCGLPLESSRVGSCSVGYQSDHGVCHCRILANE